MGRDGDKDAQPWRSVSSSAIEPGPVPPQHVTAPLPAELATSRASGKELTLPRSPARLHRCHVAYSLLLSPAPGESTCLTLLHHHLARSAPEASWERQRRAPEGPEASRVFAQYQHSATPSPTPWGSERPSSARGSFTFLQQPQISAMAEQGGSKHGDAVMAVLRLRGHLVGIQALLCMGGLRHLFHSCPLKKMGGTSLVVQWLRTCIRNLC